VTVLIKALIKIGRLKKDLDYHLIPHSRVDGSDLSVFSDIRNGLI